MTPLVSVIIPAYNRARFLPETLNSALSQSISDIECIVVDDGSTDGTHEIAAEFCARDSRVRYLRQENRGPSAARNYGLSEARGKFIQFLDSDDLIVSGKLAKQLKQFGTTNDLALSYCDYRYCAHDDVSKTVSRDNFPPPRFVMQRRLWDIASRWETKFSIPMHCFLFDARFFKERGIRFDEELPNHNDWDCWMQVFSLDPLVFHVPEVLAIYRLHDDAICADRQKLALGFAKAILKQQRIFRDDPVMSRILDEKMLEMNLVYGNPPPPKTLMAFSYYAKRFYKKFTPWPIQKFIENMSNKIFHGGKP